MSNNLFAELAWLPRPPADFRALRRGLLNDANAASARVRQLATHALDTVQLMQLGQAIGQLIESGRSLSPLSPFRLGVIGNGTLDMIAPALVASAARHGVALTCVVPAYDLYVQSALDPQSAVNTGRCDAVLIALDYRAFGLQPVPGDAEAAEARVTEALGLLASLRGAIHAHSNVPCIIQTLAPPVETLFGSVDRTIPGAVRQMVDAFNRRLLDTLEGTPDVLFDVASVAETVGLADWHAPTQWNLAKLPFADACVPLYADHVGRLLGALRGKARRCLVLDLDNTLWGGVIGDDGMGGIQLAEGDATGEAYRAVQRLVLSLRDRGIVLAVSSKNTDEIARRVFREHPEMLIREEQITVFQSNWSDKATNIKAISEELSLGLESLVFLDDNPVERGLVRRLLPEVAVPELPDDPALYARTLAAAGYFEATAFSAEDRKRAAYYEGNARRVALQLQAGDVDAYLASLDMEITFAPFDAAGRARITQLINKSNQFNLTTRRYSEATVAEAERAPDGFTLQVRLADSFGDNGMISVVICRPDESGSWEIDTWLMSCRVLGRRVEQMVLREVLRGAREKGIRRLIGIYKPTERNGMVRDHYLTLGFTQVGGEPEGKTVWALDAETEILAAPMRIRRISAPAAEPVA